MCRKLVVLVGVFAVMSSVAFAGLNAGNMPEGIATVDGDLSDWAGADWRVGTLQLGYLGSGTDISLASSKWACRWNSNGRIYAAMEIVDNDRNFENAWNTWNSSDRVEWYVHGENNTGASYYANMIDAQQYVMGSQVVNATADDYWVGMGYNKGLPSSMGLTPELKCVVDGNKITYEVSIQVFEEFHGYSGDPLDTVPTNLAAGMTIGFDIMVGSKETGGNYYMTDETGVTISAGHKADGSSNVMQEFTLVPEPVTMSLLAFGTLGVIRRKK